LDALRGISPSPLAMPHRPINTRDAALHRLSTANRWLLASSVALTGVFAEVAARAFPGKTIKASSATRARHPEKPSSRTTSKSLRPPARAPRASTTPEPAAPHETPPQESASSRESSPAQETAPAGEAAAPTEEAAPAKEAAPAQEVQPAPEPAPAKESAPVPESAPVISGGS
jgi:hypothetical protein